MWPERKVARLREYNYRHDGAYVVTICTHERRLVFGRIEETMMYLHRFGRIAHEAWLAIPSHYSNIILDEFVVMPNHVHGILFIENEMLPIKNELEVRRFGVAHRGSLSTIIGSFKSGVSKRIGEARQCPTRVWQSRFWDHVIRDERDLQNQREYILNNIATWEIDELHP